MKFTVFSRTLSWTMGPLPGGEGKRRTRKGRGENEKGGYIRGKEMGMA